MASLDLSKSAIYAQITGAQRTIFEQQRALTQHMPVVPNAILRLALTIETIGQLVAQTRDPSIEQDFALLSDDFETLQIRARVLLSRIPAAKPAAPALSRDELMMGLLSDPNSVYTYPSDPRVPSLKGFPYIRECQCIDGFKREEMRTGIPNCRQIAEDAMIKMIQEKFPLRDHPTVTLCSIASCYCAQELVVHAKLIQLGYKVNWLLVDPIYETPVGKHILHDFHQAVKLLNGKQRTEFAYLKSVEELTEKTLKEVGMKPDVFFAIDLGRFNEKSAKVFQAKFDAMERAIEVLPYPHIYLHADKMELDDVDPDSVLSRTSGAFAIRPTVSISFIDPAQGIQRKQVIGSSAWNRVNYQQAGIDLKRDYAEGPKRENLLFAEWGSQARELRRKIVDDKSPELLKQFEELVIFYKPHINSLGVDLGGGSFLHILAKNFGPVELVPILAKHGVDFGTQEEIYGNTPLMWALADGRTAMALTLLKHGPQEGRAARDYLNKKAGNDAGGGNTALHLAVGKGQEEERAPNGQIARRIVELGANVNIQNKYGNTPLHLACLRRDLDMMHFLSQNGASLTLRNADGKTPGDMLTATHAEASAILDHTSPFTLDAGRFAANEVPARELYQKLTNPLAASGAPNLEGLPGPIVPVSAIQQIAASMMSLV